MSNLNANPESTWGMTPAQKEAWVKKYAPESTNNDNTEVEKVEFAPDNPMSTWGKPVEEKVEFYQENVPDFDPETYVGGPTEVGIHDDKLFAQPEVQYTLDAGPVVYSGDDREPEYQPIYAPEGDVDYTPPAGDPAPVGENTQPQTPPVDEVVEPEAPVETHEEEEVPAPEPDPEYTEEPAVPVNQPEASDEEETEPEVVEEPAPTEEAEPVPFEEQTPVDVPTVDGQENTANESSSTGGADASQPGPTPEPPAEDGSGDGTGITEDMTVEKF